MNRFFHYAMIIAVVALVVGTALPGHAEDVAALYKSKCAVCHGPDGKADTAMGKKLAMKAFSAPEVAKMTDAQLIEVTAKGKDKMPAYESKLTGEQIKELIKYVRSLK